MKSNEAIDIIRDLKSQNEAQQTDFKVKILKLFYYQYIKYIICFNFTGKN
jgi:hypothetical protein